MSAWIDVWFVRIESILGLIVLALLLPFSRNTLLIWLVYFGCLFDPVFRKASARRWLWIVTMRALRGDHVLPLPSQRDFLRQAFRIDKR